MGWKNKQALQESKQQRTTQLSLLQYHIYKDAHLYEAINLLPDLAIIQLKGHKKKKNP